MIPRSFHRRDQAKDVGSVTAQFIHLHLHSSYSLAEGAIPIGRIKDLCLQAGMPAVAITDTNNLFGALEASVTLAGAGIQPLSLIHI